MPEPRLNYLLFLCLTMSTVGTISLHAATNVEEVAVHYIRPHEGHRHRRSVKDGLQPEMHFRLTSEGGDVTLRLKRSVMNQPSDIPVYVIRGTWVVKEDLPDIQNTASYLDQKLGASMLVKKQADGNYTLEGSYFDSNGRVNIHPQGGVIHEIRRVAEVAYGNDYVIISDNRPVYSSRGGSMRTKRRAMTDYTIGILMCADYRDFAQWTNHFSNHTLIKNAMRQFYAVVAQSMALRYASVTDVDPRLKINIQITGLLIVDSPGKSYWTERVATPHGTVEVRPALNSFKNWVRAQTGLPTSDHWMLFSGFDLTSDGDKVVTGLATLAAMCTQSSVSIIEQDFSASVGATAAHELGHSLSAIHDGSGQARGCPDSDNHIMSSKLVNPTENATASRPWEFSRCSVLAFKRYLARVYCAREVDNHHAPFITSDMANFKPGQVYTSDIQCKLTLGNQSYFARGIQYDRGFDTMCTAMYCAIPGRPRFYQRMFAMEKTTCGDGKWCIKGRCVADAQAPNTPENCPQGDDLEENCKQQDCPFFTAKARIAYCCKTCALSNSVSLHPLPSDQVTSRPLPVDHQRSDTVVPPPSQPQKPRNVQTWPPQRASATLISGEAGSNVPSVVQGFISKFQNLYRAIDNRPKPIEGQSRVWSPNSGSNAAGFWFSQFSESANPSSSDPTDITFVSNTPRPLSSSGDTLSSIFRDPSRFTWSASNTDSSVSTRNTNQYPASTNSVVSTVSNFMSNPIRSRVLSTKTGTREIPSASSSFMPQIPTSTRTASIWKPRPRTMFNIVRSNRDARPQGSNSGFLTERRTTAIDRTFCVSCSSSWSTSSSQPAGRTKSLVIQTLPRRKNPASSISWIRRSSMRTASGANVDSDTFRSVDTIPTMRGG